MVLKYHTIVFYGRIGLSMCKERILSLATTQSAYLSIMSMDF